ncbi:hypothetical protein HJC23_012245 [Cyclotella cryptica]|uniref:Zinc/iron permease n=1 Tax=Cyclotella cryptica TaxID=29204 RepID=A0ABD3PP90_9STRA
MASWRKKLAILIFEFGAVLHSVIIGVDLGVTAGDTFHALLAAICFHQFFEGIAFGCTVMISNVSSKKALATNLVYAVTTPMGLALGIAIRSTYSDTSITALWVQGISNCIAGGILLYTGLVELMTYQITTNSEFLGRSSKHRIALYIALWLGSGIMALIGKWA